MTREEKIQYIKAEIMTLDEVVAALQVSRQYVYKMKEKGILVPIICNKGTNVYLKDDVLLYAKNSANKYIKRLEFVKESKGDKLYGISSTYEK